MTDYVIFRKENRPPKAREHAVTENGTLIYSAYDMMSNPRCRALTPVDPDSVVVLDRELVDRVTMILRAHGHSHEAFTIEHYIPAAPPAKDKTLMERVKLLRDGAYVLGNPWSQIMSEWADLFEAVLDNQKSAIDEIRAELRKRK